MMGRVSEFTRDFANITDAHAGVEQQRLFCPKNKVRNCFFRLVRFVDSEHLRNDLINLEPRIGDRDAFEGLVFRPWQGAAPFRFIALSGLCAQRSAKENRAGRE